MKIEVYQPLSIHELGQRDNQEDSIIQWENSFFVLCDGMGGHEKGEVASQTVCHAFYSWFSEHMSDNATLTNDLLREALEYAYQQLDEQADGGIKQMGTTLTLLYIGNNGITAAHIGDSRIYHIRPNVGLLYQSRDHSLVYDLYQSGEITYEEMATYPQKNVITRAMTPGEDNRHRPDIIHITDIKPGDFFYMCSDGMLEQMTNDELVALLSSKISDEEKRQQLIEATTNNKDNHTAWLIHVKSVAFEEGDDQLVNEEPTARCNALNIRRPIVDDEPDVQIVKSDESDVILVPSQKPTLLKRLPWRKMLKIVIPVIALLAILLSAWVLFKPAPEPEPVEVAPQKTHLNKEKPTKTHKRYGTTRNK